jgi:hypothetical protein
MYITQVIPEGWCLVEVVIQNSAWLRNGEAFIELGDGVDEPIPLGKLFQAPYSDELWGLEAYPRIPSVGDEISMGGEFYSVDRVFLGSYSDNDPDDPTVAIVVCIDYREDAAPQQKQRIHWHRVQSLTQTLEKS